jgi:drug/metabolite transporter (DMT)-like permease
VAGISAALFAAAAWSMTFLVPHLVGEFTIIDFYLVDFTISGLASLGFLILDPTALRRLTWRDWAVVCWLGWVGYTGYSLILTEAATYAGPVVAPAFVALVPVVLAIAGNIRQPVVPWREFAFPLTLAVGGLLLINVDWTHTSAPVPSPVLGISLSILVVILWTVFGLLNQAALHKRPQIGTGTWTALMICGAAVGMLALVPFAWITGSLTLPRIDFHTVRAARLCISAAAAALLVNTGGAVAWNFATRRLPVSLAAQMITLEPTFGTPFLGSQPAANGPRSRS